MEVVNVEPGAVSRARAQSLTADDADLARIDEALPHGAASGER